MSTTSLTQSAHDFDLAEQRVTHSVMVGYLVWLFGFFGAHRFYFGKRLSGTVWFFTLGLLGVGWIIDLFLISGMQSEANQRFQDGPINMHVAWLLLTFLGIFGLHRLYMGKWVTGILYLATGAFFGTGWLYDLWTLNQQVTEINSR